MTKNYLSLDLELNNSKIIQIGIAIGSTKANIHTHKWYINPGEPISGFITKLTGITQQDIDEKAVDLSIAAFEIGELIKKHNTFVNPVQWGHDDSKYLKEEFKARDIKFPHFGHRDIDVKTIFTYIQASRNMKSRSGLRNSMQKFNLKFEGDAHRADIDAYNTLVFYFHLTQRQSELEKLGNIKK